MIPLREHAGIPDLVDRNARVQFDADGSGIRKEWSWITPNAGWLVHAPEKFRPITSALQMFGSVTFWLFWDNGYQALDALDDNRDGSLSGVELEDLGIWQDANMNGISESGEVKPVAEWGIVSIACEHQSTPATTEHAAFASRGVTFADGRSRPTYDIWLQARPGVAISD